MDSTMVPLPLVKKLVETMNDSQIFSSAHATAFTKACFDGNEDVVDLLWKIERPSNDVLHSRTFATVCDFGHLHIAKWLLKNVPHLDTRIDYNKSFTFACASGNIDLVKWLLEIAPNIDVRTHAVGGFQWACHNGHLEIAKFLFELVPDINVRQNGDYALKNSMCRHFEVSKWLVDTFPDALESIQDLAGHLLKQACYGGNLEAVQWIKGLAPDVLIDPEIFKNACFGGNVDVLRWTLERAHSENVDEESIRREIRGAFDTVVSNGCVDVAKFLYEMNPEMKLTQYNFESACLGRYYYLHTENSRPLECIKWMYDTIPRVVVHSKYAKNAFLCGQQDLTEWFFTRFPDKLPSASSFMYFEKEQNRKNTGPMTSWYPHFELVSFSLRHVRKVAIMDAIERRGVPGLLGRLICAKI